MTSIHDNCLNGDIKYIKIWLNTCQNINVFDARGCTPLYYACKNNHLSCVKLLIENNASIEKTGHNECTPLMATCLNINDIAYDCALYLISKGANVNKKEHDGVSILHLAVRNNNIKIVKLLISHGANVNATYYKTYTVLSESKSKEITNYLIKNGAK